MSQVMEGPKLLLPFLERFYERAIPFSWLIVPSAAAESAE